MKLAFLKAILEAEKIHGLWVGVVISDRDWIYKDDSDKLTYMLYPEPGESLNIFKKFTLEQIQVNYIPDTLVSKKRYIGDLIFADELIEAPKQC